MGTLLDLTGSRFGRLAVLARTGTKRGRPMWLCMCDCGKFPEVSGENLRGGITTSCGCYHAERLSTVSKAVNTKHGMSKSKTYSIWANMKDRCHNPNNHAFDLYGGRGIQVCDRWRESFQAFVDDMGEQPPGLTLDRIDVNGNYEPGNCRWTTWHVQANNKRTSKKREVAHG